MRFGMLVAWFFGWGIALVMGSALHQFARGLARFDEQTDAIGSTRHWSQVQPAGWKVWLYRAAGRVLVFGCLLAFVVGGFATLGLATTWLYLLGWGVAVLLGLVQYRYADAFARIGSTTELAPGDSLDGIAWLNRAVASLWLVACLLAAVVGVFAEVA